MLAVKAEGAAKRAGLLPDDVILTFDGQNVKGPRELVALTGVAPQDRKVYVEIWRDRKKLVYSLPAVDGVVDQKLVARAESDLKAAQAAADRLRQGSGKDVPRAQKRLDDARAKLDRAVARLEGRVLSAQQKLATLDEGVAAPAPAPAAAAKPAPGKGRSLGVRTQSVSGRDAKNRGVQAGALILATKPDGAADHAGLKVNDVIVAFDGRAIASSGDLAKAVRGVHKKRKIFIEIVRNRERLVVTLLPEGATQPQWEGRKPPKPSGPEVEPAGSPQGQSRPDNRHLIPNRRPAEVGTALPEEDGA